MSPDPAADASDGPAPGELEDAPGARGPEAEARGREARGAEAWEAEARGAEARGAEARALEGEAALGSSASPAGHGPGAATRGASPDALRAAREALRGTEAWLVGGSVRDRALGRESRDLDLIVEEAPERAARAIARAAGGAACFELSEEFAGWRVMARDRAWQVDVQPLRGGSLAADLALRDFTVNAIAQPLAAGTALEDPLGGLADLAAGRLRMASPHAFAEDPLRALRLVRFALELHLEPDPDTARAATAAAGALSGVAGERVFGELRLILASPHAPAGLRQMDELALTPAVLPEVAALHGVHQSRYHHRDVHGHTLEALERVIALQVNPAAILGEGKAVLGEGKAVLGEGEGRKKREGKGKLGERGGGLADGEGALIGGEGELAGPIAALLAEPLADELTRGEALRWGALLHDVAKPLTRAVRPDGRVTFMGHDTHGAQLARDLLERLHTSERLRAHVAALVRHHLRLGFLVRTPQRPLPPRAVFDYLASTSPVEVDVTLLSVADRLATRGDRAAEAIQAHLSLARTMLTDALRWRAHGPPPPLWRGDELATELGIATGPRIGELLRELTAAQYAGEVSTRAQALAHARAFLVG